MNRLLACILVLLFAADVRSQDNLPFVGPSLVLVHPTEHILETYQKLQACGLLPDTIGLIGAYHVDEPYDYTKAQAWALEHKMQVRFYAVTGTLTEANIYTDNPCTGQFEDLFCCSQGMIFNGGPDILPKYYGAKTSLHAEITDPARHLFELSLMFHLIGGSQNLGKTPLLERKPLYMVLGICLGMQTMNVAAGGTLVQDIPSEIYQKQFMEDVLAMPGEQQHRNYYKLQDPSDEHLTYGTLHPLVASRDNAFWQALNPGPGVLVYSSHHQSICKTGHHIRATAWSTDRKIIEAVEHAKYANVTGVQFHPEVSMLHSENDQGRTIPLSGESVSKTVRASPESADFYRKFWDSIIRKRST